MTEAQQMADKINTHIADGTSLMVFSGRARSAVCLLPFITQDLRREWRNVAFR